MKFYTYFSNQQRLAVVGLIVVIVFLEVLSIFPKPNGYDGFQVDLESYLKFQNEITQQIVLNEIKSAPKIYPFNPNFITDYKGYKLGMNSKEINRLLLYRAQNKWINSAKEFQNVTKVSDSFLHIISLNFKFPDWVKNSNKTSVSLERPISFEDKIDLNITTVNELQKVYGVGSVLSNRIIKLRDSFIGGFISDIQLQDVRGLTPETIENIRKQFSVKTPRTYLKISLNTATVDQLVTIQHIDYELAYEIIELRMLKEGYKIIDELSKVKGFPVKKLEIIKLYLTLN
ncbi:MAG: helix-hairpin-helix domain-containing protein [Flavobacteriaceae bacterium]